jgi:hypothetical protein
LGAFFAAQKTGLSACIFSAFGGKGYRFYPLRGRTPAEFAYQKMASLPFLSCKFFALQKTHGTIVAGPPPEFEALPQTPALPVYSLKRRQAKFSGMWES